MSKEKALELVLDATEVAFKQTVESSLIKDIPIVGSIVKLYEIGASVRDHFYTAKMERFLSCLNDVSPHDKDRLLITISSKKSDGEVGKLTEKILLIIESQSDMEKSEIIANLFLAYIDGKMESSTFRPRRPPQTPPPVAGSNSPTCGGGVLLDQEEHEQEQKSLQLLVVQLDGQCQSYHGIRLDYAGSAANLLKVGICNAPLPGAALGLPRMALSGGLAYPLGRDGSVYRPITHGGCDRTKPPLWGRTLSRAATRQLGLLTQVRYPARGSARVTPMEHNDRLHRQEKASEAPLSTVRCKAWFGLTNCIRQIGWAERRIPSARATFNTVSNLGFAPGDKAL